MLVYAGAGKNGAAERPISGPHVFTNERGKSVLPGKTELTIRVAKVDQASQIVELMRMSFSGKKHLSRVSFANLNDIEQLMTQGQFLLAENEKGIIGCAYLEPHIEASRLDLLAVAREQQRAGIGSQLLEAAEALSRSMQCLFVHVRVMNFHWETIKFCQRRGYVAFGIESLNEDQPVSQHCHLVRMCKRLNADCLGF